MSKYTFMEFIAAQEGDDFNVIEQDNLDWAKGFVESMGRSGKWIHEGDCTKQNVSCPLCVYELYLKEYREYYFSEEPKERTFTTNEMEFIKNCIGFYWENWNSTHPDNQEDWNISQGILNK